MNASLFIQCIITGKQSNYYCDETKKMALNSQTKRAKINPPPVEPRWAHLKPNTRQWPTNETFCQGCHCVWSLTHRECHAFLITKRHFSLFSMTNEIKIASLKCRLEPKFQFFVTSDFDPIKLHKLDIAKYLRYCFENFTHDVNNIEFLFNIKKLNAFNSIKLL